MTKRDKLCMAEWVSYLGIEFMNYHRSTAWAFSNKSNTASIVHITDIVFVFVVCEEQIDGMGTLE
jgi:hypothetical protein